MDPILEAIRKAILEGETTGVTENIQKALDAGVSVRVLLNNCLISSMTEVGKLFEDGEYYIPEMLISAKAMKAGLEILKPHLMQSNIKAKGIVVIGTVQGDLHDIGKNLVGIMLEGAGFEVVDLGSDVTPEKFVDAVKTHQANVVAMSALLTTTMPRMKEIIDALYQSGLRDQVKIMVGGAPVTSDYAARIGADGYSEDASRAVALAQRLVE